MQDCIILRYLYFESMMTSLFTAMTNKKDSSMFLRGWLYLIRIAHFWKHSLMSSCDCLCESSIEFSVVCVTIRSRFVREYIEIQINRFLKTVNTVSQAYALQWPRKYRLSRSIIGIIFEEVNRLNIPQKAFKQGFYHTFANLDYFTHVSSLYSQANASVRKFGIFSNQGLACSLSLLVDRFCLRGYS